MNSAAVDAAVVPPDGRATRWESHNVERRRALVKSTLKAIRRHGAAVGVDQIAAEAGTSKTVLYRHFGGRTGLYAAVVESVHERITADLRTAFADAERLEPTQMVRQLTEAYLVLVERDPEIYQFVVDRPAGQDRVADPVTGITGRIGDELAQAFAVWLRAHRLDPEAANTWGHGVVGFVWAVADKWITTGHRRPRADIVEYTVRLFEPAFAHHEPAPIPGGTR